MTVERGQIIWLNFNPQKGHEQSGRRPALVISPADYNAISNCILVCPITANTNPWPWKVMLPADGEVHGAILVDQIKSIDATARQFTATGQTLKPALMAEIRALMLTLIDET